jgi:hypothetical protein
MSSIQDIISKFDKHYNLNSLLYSDVFSKFRLEEHQPFVLLIKRLLEYHAENNTELTHVVTFTDSYKMIENYIVEKAKQNNKSFDSYTATIKSTKAIDMLFKCLYYLYQSLNRAIPKLSKQSTVDKLQLNNAPVLQESLKKNFTKNIHIMALLLFANTSVIPIMLGLTLIKDFGIDLENYEKIAKKCKRIIFKSVLSSDFSVCNYNFKNDQLTKKSSMFNLLDSKSDTSFDDPLSLLILAAILQNLQEKSSTGGIRLNML